MQVNMKYMGTTLTEDMQGLFTEKYRHHREKLSKTYIKGEMHHAQRSKNIIKMLILSQFIYRVNATIITITMDVFEK